MDANKLLKKLEEIKVDAFNNLSSSEKDSSLQVESETEFELDEDAKGEDVKIERTKGEKYKLPDTLSRTTPMAGPTKHNPSEKVYVTDGSTKKSIRQKLDEFKEFLEVRKTGDYYGSGRTPEESSILEAMQLVEEHIEKLEAMDEENRLKDWWFAEMEHAKIELKQLEDMLANVNDPNWKPFKKNDPMTTAQMILDEGPKNDKEAEIHLLLRDAHGKNDEASIRQVLMMLPQGM